MFRKAHTAYSAACLHPLRWYSRQGATRHLPAGDISLNLREPGRARRQSIRADTNKKYC